MYQRVSCPLLKQLLSVRIESLLVAVLSFHSPLTSPLLSALASWLVLAHNSLSGWEYDLIEQVSSLSLLP